MKLLILLLTFLCILDLVQSVITQGPKNTTYWRNIDTTGYLECIVSTSDSESSPEVHWIVKSQLIASNGKYSISASAGNRSLTVYNLQRNDTGQYTCQQGQVSIVHAWVLVADPPGDPEITTSVASPVENNTVRFTCKSNGGYPAPTFSWTKKGEAIPESTRNLVGGLSSSDVNIKLSHTDHEKDIKCTVTHPLINKTTMYTMNVQYSPRVTLSTTSGELNVLKNDNFSLKCDVRSNPAYDSLAWTRNGVRLSESSEDLIQSIDKDSQYSCSVRNAISETNVTANLVVHYAPEITILQGSNLSKNEGERLVITCEADAVPSATFQWKKGSDVEASGPELIISSLSRNDAGEYRCVASNAPLGQSESRSKAINIVVKYAPSKPTLSVTPERTSGIWNEGDSIVLRCSSSSGVPAADYIWYLDGQPVSTGALYRIQSAGVNHTGEYTCKASNSVGVKISEPSVITVHGVPELVSTSQSTVNVSKSDNGTIACTFKGLPKPVVYWKYNDDKIIESDDQYLISETVSQSGAYEVVFSTIQFTGVQVSDYGVYSCMAVNSSDSGHITVNVFAEPEFIGLGKAAADVGQGVTLSCDVWSYPPVSSIEFRQDDKLLTSSQIITIDDIVYKVDGKVYQQRRRVRFHQLKAENYGNYQCVAKNSLGEKQFNITLQETSSPDTPTNLYISDLKWDSFTIQWTPGFNGGKPQWFLIHLNGSKLESSNDTYYHVSGLLPSTKYHISVTSMNALGRSNKTQLVVTSLHYVVPTPNVDYNDDTDVLTVSLSNSTNYCVIIEASNDDKNFKPLYNGKCHRIEGSKDFKMTSPIYEYYRAKVCLVGRVNEVCSKSSVDVVDSHQTSDEEKVKMITIAVVLTMVVVVIIIIIIAVIFAYRKNKRALAKASKSASPLPDNSHVNQVMINDFEVETPYSTFSAPNNNLNAGNNVTSPHYQNSTGNAQQDSVDNLNYVYASIKRKSVVNEEKMLNTHQDMYEMGVPNSPPESNSDNTDAETLEELPIPHDPHNLSQIIGSNPPPYQRFSSMSESGHSSPDSKIHKKVIYEVIV